MHRWLHDDPRWPCVTGSVTETGLSQSTGLQGSAHQSNNVGPLPMMQNGEISTFPAQPALVAHRAYQHAADYAILRTQSLPNSDECPMTRLPDAGSD